MKTAKRVPSGLKWIPLTCQRDHPAPRGCPTSGSKVFGSRSTTGLRVGAATMAAMTEPSGL